MSVKDTYIDLCEARIEALTRELDLLKKFVCREYRFKEISDETTMVLFEAFKAAQNADAQGSQESNQL
jgi:hypothetical protein